MGIDDRTTKALGDDVMKKLRSLQFCIVGCGATGANFAEMLVRSGATRITLIDGTKVEESNLNRVFSFSLADSGKPKVKVLEQRLKAIRGDLKICSLCDNFRSRKMIMDDGRVP